MMNTSIRSMRSVARQFSSYKDTDVVVAGFARTPLGKLGGALAGGKSVTPLCNAYITDQLIML